MVLDSNYQHRSIIHPICKYRGEEIKSNFISKELALNQFKCLNRKKNCGKTAITAI